MKIPSLGITGKLRDAEQLPSYRKFQSHLTAFKFSYKDSYDRRFLLFREISPNLNKRKNSMSKVFLKLTSVIHEKFGVIAQKSIFYLDSH